MLLKLFNSYGTNIQQDPAGHHCDKAAAGEVDNDDHFAQL